MKTLVMKFGGTTLGGAASALEQVAQIIDVERRQWDNVIVVASALYGVTDKLIEGAQLSRDDTQRGRHRQSITNVRTRHMTLIENLNLAPNDQSSLQADVEHLLFDTLDLYHSISKHSPKEPTPDLLDAAIGVGERLSARIIAALLRKYHIHAVALDATGFIITDDNFGHAKPDMAQSAQQIQQQVMPLLERGIVPVITGYIGATSKGKMTTLGRGGSDLTAAVMAICTQATELWLWSSVDGLMTADPSLVPNAHLVERINYHELSDLARFGARIVHRDTAILLRNHHIPLRIRNIEKPDSQGSSITDHSANHTIKGIATIHGLRFSIEHHAPLTDLLLTLDATLHSVIKTEPEIVYATQSSSQSDVYMIIPSTAGPGAPEKAFSSARNALQLEAALHAWEVTAIALVSVVGLTPKNYQTVFNIALQYPIITSILNPSGSLSFVVEEGQQRALVEALHTELIG